MYCEIDAVTSAVELADLHAGGLFVQSNTAPVLEGEVDVMLRLGELTLRCSGHVVQVVSRERAIGENRRPGFGLLFTNIDENDRIALRRAIDAAHAALLAASRSSDMETEERSILADLRDELAAMAEDPWEILALERGASLEQARQAFFDASKRYHPHRYSRYRLPEIKQVVTELFIAHKRAFTYIEKRSTRGVTPQHITPQPMQAVEVTPSMYPAEPGSRAIRPKTAAAHGAARADSTRARSADIESLVTSALKHLAQSRFADAETELRKAIELDGTSSKARVWLLVTQARRARAGGELASAAEKYFEVLTLDPKHHEALSETKKLGRDAAGKPGLLGRFFGSGNK